MTRFARRDGNFRKKEDATDWDNMFKSEDNNNNQRDNDDSKSENRTNKNKKFNNKDGQDSKFNAKNRDNKSNFKKSKGKYDDKNPKLDIQKLEKLLDKEVLDDLTRLRNQKKINYKEYITAVKREAKRNERRMNRIKERDDKKVCFKCRESGHSVFECPEMKKDVDQGTGICYKCGSTEHSVHQCKVKVEPGRYPYAKCFICNETGHLSKQCPDNPRGLYPNGGACKSCNSVEHYQRDCPLAPKEESTEPKTLNKLKAFDNVEELDNLDSDAKKSNRSKEKKKKIVKF